MPSQQLLGSQAILRKLRENRSQSDLQQSTLTASWHEELLLPSAREGLQQDAGNGKGSWGHQQQ